MTRTGAGSTTSSPPLAVDVTAGPSPAARVRLPHGIAAVAAGQLARVRLSRGPLLLVATVQSLGLVVLLRGIVHHHDLATSSAIVAGSSVLVVAFVALNLLAQRLGVLRAASALDYYAALPISAAAVVLGTAASYAAFTVPGALATAIVGIAIYGLSFANLWLVVPVIVTAALALAGAGALLGLTMPRPEFATIAGQLGMTVVLFLGIIPPSHFPEVVRAVRVLVPGMLAIDGFAAGLRPDPDWLGIVSRLAITAGYGAVLLAVADRAFRRAVDR